MVTLYQLYRKTIDILLNMIDHGSLAAEREAIKELVYDLRALERHSPHLFAKHAEMRIAQTRPKLRSGEPCFLVEFLLCLVPFMGPTLLEKYHNAKQPQSQRTMKVCNLGLFSERFKHSSFTGSLESLANMREDLQCAPQTSTMRN